MKSRGVALATAALVVAGCKADPTPSGEPKPARDAGAERPRETAILTAVAIERIEPARPLPIRDEDLTRRIGAILTSSPAFLEEGEKPPAGRVAVPAVVAVTLRYDVVTPPAGAARRVAVVGVEAEVDWKTGGERMAPRENVLIERPLEKADEARLGPLMLELAAQAVEQAGRGLVAKESLRQGDDGAVLAALGQPDPDLVLWALDLCAARRLAGAFDRAIALLESSDPGVQAAALRVLVALRDPRAVEPLARRADFADPDTMRALVEAVTAIGGPEAIEFLEMVAGGHAEPDMRQRAREGLERLGRRQRKDP